ncbi:ABC transporter permease [Luteimonas sp. TWI1416]|uniref:ABC transporter permease n=1 Tax=unclassified Luteimonas TaxID=2629088 RepID=UPI0032098390
MLGYYCNLAVRSFRRNRMLTALMVLAIALGIGASMTTLTVFHVLSGDPIPDKSDRLFHVQLDPEPMTGYMAGGEPARNMTRFDSETLLHEARGKRQAFMTGGFVALEPEGASPYFTDARYTTGEFFPMFDAPMAFGRGWSAQDDADAARVAVISAETNQKVFGGGDSTGKTLRIDGNAFQVIGVLAPWRPTPRFWDLNLDGFEPLESVFVPFSAAMDAKLSRMGSMSCWGDSSGIDSNARNAPCAWLQYWVELDTPGDAAAYRDYLLAYSEQQRQAGRFVRPANVRLRDVRAHLDYAQIVPGDVRLQVWLAFGFLLVCLVNTVGLLLAKSLRRASEIGVRRSLGASRKAIFAQFLVEAGTIGVAGGIAGLAVALCGLWAVRQAPSTYAELARLDPTMLLTTFVLSIVATLLAGLLPAWRATQVTPAIQLKSN